MATEISALEQNQTWKVVSLPKNTHTIGCRWVYKIKYSVDGSIERYKARLVAKGYNHQEGIDYTDSFTPVTKLVTFKLVLSLAATQNWHLHQLDVNNAFIHGDLHEDIFMTLHHGYHHKGSFHQMQFVNSKNPYIAWNKLQDNGLQKISMPQ